MNALDLLESLYKKNIVLELQGENIKIRADKGAVDAEALSAIRECKPQLIDLLTSMQSQDDASSTVIFKQHPECTIVPLSFEQQSMLYLDAISENKHHYNMSAQYKVTGTLQTSILNQVLVHIVNEHSILRTVYPKNTTPEELGIAVEGQIVSAPKSILNECHINVQDLDLALSTEASRTFDLGCDIPIRACLFHIHGRESSECYLSLTLHHIAADGWSVGVLLQEITKRYTALCQTSNSDNNGTENTTTQYYDYTHWQADVFNTDYRQKLIAYWSQQLTSLPELHNFPTDFQRPAVQNFVGASYTQILPVQLSETLDTAAKKYGVTPFILFQSVFSAVLKRYTNTSDIVFGTVTANRQHAQVMQTIGMFANALVIRHNVDNNCNFEQLLQQVSDVSQHAFEHGQLPFDMLVEALQPKRSLSYNPLMQIMLVMQENHEKNFALEGLDVSFIEHDLHVSKFDLSLHVAKQDGHWQCRWEYSTSLFKAATIERLHKHFIRMADCLLANPTLPISEQTLVTYDELPLHTVHNSFPEPTSVHSLIEQHANVSPDAPAVYGPDDEVLTYKELNERASYLASLLQAQLSFASQPFVGVSCERNIDLVVSMLAIFKCGGVYVPIDATYPVERIDYMLGNSDIALLLTTSAVQQQVPCFTRVATLLLESIDFSVSVNYANSALPNIGAEQTAYMIYTSGSTGKPKGVLVSHANLYQSMHANRSIMEINRNDVMPCLGSMGFGASILEMCLPLTSGAAVYMLPKSDVTDMGDLIRHTSSLVTVMHMVPSLLKVWLQELQSEQHTDVYTKLRLLLTGGEAVPKRVLTAFKQYFPEKQILGLYGMTEAAIVCFSHAPTVNDDNSPTYCLGVPHAHMQAFVMNDRQQLQPVGCAGELHLSGPSLAKGYLHRKAQTQSRFISHAFPERQAQRLYKTGDCARLLDNGRFEFMGRTDNQISIRGFRIEIGEIENCLQAHQDVHESLVIARTHDDHTQLIAYMVGKSGVSSMDVTMLRHYMSERLPHYMVPAHFLVLEAFPLNPNGKIDRAALPDIQNIDTAQTVIAPVTEQEKALVRIWSQVLGLPEDRIGINDNFFDLGGDSILSLKVVDLARTQSIPISPQRFFQHQTIAELALLEEDALVEMDTAEGPLPLTVIQKSVLSEKTADINNRHIKIVRQVDSAFDYATWAKAVEYVIEHHMALRTAFDYRDGQWYARIQPMETGKYVERIDVSSMTPEEQEALVEYHSRYSLNIEQGLCLKLFFFHDTTHEHSTMVLLQHHILSDQVSMNLMLSDLYRCIGQLNAGDELSLPSPTASTRQIAQAFESYAASKTLRKDLAYWLSLPEEVYAELPTDHPVAPYYLGVVRDEKVETFMLSQEDTEALTQAIAPLSGVTMRDLVVFVLVNVFAEWSERDWIRISVMDNARQLFPEMPPLDTTRTVGYLCMYMTLCLQKTQSTGIDAIPSMYAQMKAVPHNGFSYDMLYWANETLPEHEKVDFPVHVNDKTIGLNYHGVVGQDVDNFLSTKENYKGNSEEGDDYSQDPGNAKICQFHVHAQIIDGQLMLKTDYSTELYRPETVREIVRQLETAFVDIAAFQCNQVQASVKNSDKKNSDTLQHIE